MQRVQRIAPAVLGLVFVLAVGVGTIGDAQQNRQPQKITETAVAPQSGSELLFDLDSGRKSGLRNAQRWPEVVNRIRPRTVRMEVTAYCACRKCCGVSAIGITASGLHVTHNDGRFVAADTDILPFGSRVMVPGYNEGRPVDVIDRGRAIKGYRLDVYFPSHETALEWGRRWLDVKVVEMGSK